MKCLVAGAGGFIGSHLAEHLKRDGNIVIGADIKLPEFKATREICDSFVTVDLRESIAADRLQFELGPFDEVYQLAADMGGMGYVYGKDADIFTNNSLINAHMIRAAHRHKTGRYLFASSACVYPEELQMGVTPMRLREDMAFPANPQDGYSWEKLMGELACGFYRQQHGLETRIVRFHTVYGPYGTWTGGREKVVAALCRKAAEATRGGEIEIWGDGEQVRSFLYIEDAVRGMLAVMRSADHTPFNIGSEQSITINALADLIEVISGKVLSRKFVPGPEGVRSRNSDSSKARELVNWRIEVPLASGVAGTYEWIVEELRRGNHV